MELIPALSTIILAATCLTVPLLALFVWSLVWAYRDAERRRQSGLLVALFVAVAAWPLGLVVWMLVRAPLDGPGQA